jgi:hypothetical protein
MKVRWCRLAFAACAFLALSTAQAFATDTVTPPKPEPVVMVSAFHTTPATLTAGGRFKLEITLKEETGVDAPNLQVTLGSAAVTSTAGTVVSSATPDAIVVLGGNSRFITLLAGYAKKKLTFELVSNPQAPSGPYSIPITLQCDSPNGGRTVTMQSVGVMLTRTIVFDVGALTYPKLTTADTTFSMSVSVRNTNSFAISGVLLSFESSAAQWVSHETTVGLLEPGQSATFTATGIAGSAGEMPVTMAISYLDDYNQAKQIRRDISITVREKPAVPAAGARTSAQALILFLKALVGIGG